MFPLVMAITATVTFRSCFRLEAACPPVSTPPLQSQRPLLSHCEDQQPRSWGPAGSEEAGTPQSDQRLREESIAVQLQGAPPPPPASNVPTSGDLPTGTEVRTLAHHWLWPPREVEDRCVPGATCAWPLGSDRKTGRRGRDDGARRMQMKRRAEAVGPTAPAPPASRIQTPRGCFCGGRRQCLVGVEDGVEVFASFSQKTRKGVHCFPASYATHW
ncbi:uncharacterized protein LOC128627497 [Artibeus jamaicensis]|uniref:uncharacterized protein LOC128627497 n=1 Tax=Artibeus jamaicensis TaxID=9417 RepID=UPI00235ADBC9|nr:uncharacterized protein LOC128627497 [Artibeus jamaicensis]